MNKQCVNPAHIFVALTGVVLIFLHGALPASGWGGAAVPSPDEELVFEWTPLTPDIRLRPDRTVEIRIPGYDQISEPGMVSIPVTSTLIAIPHDAVPRLDVLALEEMRLPLPGPLAVVPQSEQGFLVPRDRIVEQISGVPSEEIRPPDLPLVFEEIGVLRGVRLARITFYPVLPDDGGVRVIRYAKARITGLLRLSRAFVIQDLLLEQLQNVAANPDDVVPLFPSQPLGLTSSLSEQKGPIALLEVGNPGMYRLSYAQLAPMGFSAVDPRLLHLYRGPDEVAYEWEGDEDSLFELGEGIVFYAEPRFSRYTAVDVYRLEAGDTPGLRVATHPADPESAPAGVVWLEQLMEINTIYTPDCFCGRLPPGRDGDRWVWRELRRPTNATAYFRFTVPSIDSRRPASLTLWMIGFTAIQTSNPDHRVNVMLNGTHVGRLEWDGKTAVTQTFSLPAGVLSSANVLALSLPGIENVNVEGAWVDAFVVRYAMGTAPLAHAMLFSTGMPSERSNAPAMSYRVYLPLVLSRFASGLQKRAYTVALAADGPYRLYDVTDPLRPRRLTDFRVLNRMVTFGAFEDGFHRYFVTAESWISAPVRIRTPENLWIADSGPTGGAHYLVITHPLFAGTLAPLLELRRDQGLTVAVANVLGVYDHYGDGRPDPEAIRRFIMFAYNTWNPRPVYVLLVGDGSFDPRRYRSDSPPTYVPVYLVDADPWAGEIAADNRYVCVDGDDRLPDLLLGRLPVDSPAEAAAVVDKIVASERTPLPGGWNRQVLLVADNPDGGGDFTALSEQAAVQVTAPFSATRRHYYAGDDPSVFHQTVWNDWNRGALLVQFAGHASWQQWAVERFLHLDDVRALSNTRRLPVVVELTCFTGAFHRPEATLDEELVTQDGVGALAVWGPTGLGLGLGHSYLSKGFFQAVFKDEVVTVGEAVLAGKLELARSGFQQDLLDTFTLLGDPAQRFQRALIPWAVQLYLPLVVR